MIIVSDKLIYNSHGKTATHDGAFQMARLISQLK